MMLAGCATAAARQHQQLLGLRSLSSRVGLFGMERLQAPEDWRALVERTKARCTELVQEVVSAPSGIEAIRNTDELSDTICKTYDAAELCRNVHTSSEWRAEAQNACISLGGFLSHLNVHQGLYHAVASAVGGGAQASGSGSGSPQAGTSSSGGEPLSPAAARVGQLLCQDFEAHGVHLEGDAQHRFIEASAREQLLCMQFGQNMADASQFEWLSVPAASGEALLGGLSGGARGQVRREGRGRRALLRLPMHESVLGELLSRVPDASCRRQAFLAGYSGPAANVALVQQLVDTRQEIAELLGSPSYAHYQAGRDTLAEHPAAISAFLKGLGEAVRDKAAEEVAVLQRHSGSKLPKAWDELFLRGRAHIKAGLAGNPALCTLQTCLAHLDEMCRSLLDVRLASLPLAPGEAWAPDLQKLALQDGSGAVLGHLYLDLCARQGKVQGPGVQYTLVNGRALRDGSYQAPLVALVCNFPHAAAAPLSVVAVLTLFHEFGHVLNALLNTTEFQHVAGTRGTSDCVEVASQLFEYLALDERVFGRDAASAAALQHYAKQQRMFAALDLQKQVFYARLDQELHSGGGGGREAELVPRLMEETLSFPPVPGVSPQARFSHLATAGSHGSKYYSYLYSKAFAAAAWQRHLASDPFDAAAGRHLRQGLLEVGLSVPPREMVQRLLGDGAVHACAEGGCFPNSRHLLAEVCAA